MFIPVYPIRKEELEDRMHKYYEICILDQPRDRFLCQRCNSVIKFFVVDLFHLDGTVIRATDEQVYTPYCPRCEGDHMPPRGMGRIYIGTGKLAVWEGRCRPCNSVWQWPREGNLLRDDLAKGPTCPRCQNGKPLRRTMGSTNPTFYSVGRQDVGL